MTLKKSLLAASIALTLGTTAAQGAFTLLADGAYQMTITGGCFAFGNCVAAGTSTLTDNTAAQTTFDQTVGNAVPCPPALTAAGSPLTV